jgi:hypothetical protein
MVNGRSLRRATGTGLLVLSGPSYDITPSGGPADATYINALIGAGASGATNKVVTLGPGVYDCRVPIVIPKGTNNAAGPGTFVLRGMGADQTILDFGAYNSDGQIRIGDTTFVNPGSGLSVGGTYNLEPFEIGATLFPVRSDNPGPASGAPPAIGQSCAVFTDWIVKDTKAAFRTRLTIGRVAEVIGAGPAYQIRVDFGVRDLCHPDEQMEGVQFDALIEHNPKLLLLGSSRISRNIILEGVTVLAGPNVPGQPKSKDIIDARLIENLKLEDVHVKYFHTKATHIRDCNGAHLLGCEISDGPETGGAGGGYFFGVFRGTNTRIEDCRAFRTSNQWGGRHSIIMHDGARGFYVLNTHCSRGSWDQHAEEWFGRYKDSSRTNGGISLGNEGFIGGSRYITLDNCDIEGEIQLHPNAKVIRVLNSRFRTLTVEDVNPTDDSGLKPELGHNPVQGHVEDVLVDGCIAESDRLLSVYERSAKFLNMVWQNSTLNITGAGGVIFDTNEGNPLTMGLTGELTIQACQINKIGSAASGPPIQVRTRSTGYYAPNSFQLNLLNNVWNYTFNAGAASSNRVLFRGLSTYQSGGWTIEGNTGTALNLANVVQDDTGNNALAKSVSNNSIALVDG